MFSHSLHAELEIQLTEDDRRNGEEVEFIPIGVRKNFRIAVPITFTISPVTLQEARAMNLFPVGVDLPNNNGGRSPIDAGTVPHCNIYYNAYYHCHSYRFQ